MDDNAVTLKLIAELSIRFEFVPKIKIEVIIPDDIEDFVVNAVLRSAHTGKFGDGKLFIIPVEDVVRIRTEERGEAAL
jgi:nitrogen regulatory protein P-II 1